MQHVLGKRIPLLLVKTKKIEHVPRRLVPGSCAIQVPVDFRHRAKQERQNKKLIANRNIKAGKAKTKLMMDSKQESLDESKKVRRTSLVSLL